MSLSICLIGYQLTDADMKKLQSYLESLEPDRYPLIPGSKYISVVIYSCSCHPLYSVIHTLIYHLLARVVVFLLVLCVTFSMSIEML